MRGNFLIIGISLGMLLSFPGLINAQVPSNPTIDQGYTSYLAAFDEYRSSHQEYETTKASYLRYKNPVTEKDFLEQGKKILKNRDDVMINYLNFLLLRLVISPGVDFTNQTIFQPKLKDDINWYTTHKGSIDAVSNLPDLNTKSKDFEKQYKNTLALINQSLGMIFIGKIYILGNEIENLNSLLSTRLTLVPPMGNEAQTANQWLIEARNRQFLSQNQTSEAINQFNKLTTYQSDVGTTFNAGKSNVMQSFQYLKESFSYLKQIIGIVSHE